METITLPSPHAVWTVADEHGWHEPSASFGEDIALCHSELSEALEAFRKDAPAEEITEELADCVIRILHVCAKNNLDIETAVHAKHEKNKGRPYRHGYKKL